MLESSVPDSSKERAQARLSVFLLHLSDTLRLLTDKAAIEHMSLHLLRTHLGIPRALYAEAFGQDGTLRVLAESAEPGLTPMEGQVLRLADFAPDALTGRPVWHDDVLQGTYSPEQQAGHTTLGTRAWAMVPLLEDGRLTAAFTVHASEVRRWTPEDITAMQETAERTRDAVKRARAETALRESEEKYRTLFTETDEAYAVVEVMADAAGRWNDFLFTEVNPAFMRHTGMPYPVGRTATGLLGTPNPRWAQLYGQVAQTGEPLRVEESELTLGRIFDLNIFRLGGGGSRRVAVLFTDITERKRAEESVRRSEKQLRGVLDGMGEGFGLLAPDFTILEHNREALRLDGRPAEAVIGRSHWEVYPGSEDSELGRLYKQAMAERVPVSLEHNYAWEEGRALWLEMRAYPTDNGSLAVFWHDVTDRREAQEALHASQERHELALEATQLGTFVWNIQEDRAEADGRMMELLDQQPGGLSLGEALATMIYPADVQRYATAVAAAVRADGPRTLSEDVRVRRADGSWRWIAITGKTSFGEAGQPLRMYGTALDITERKRAEEVLRESQERQAFLLQLSDALRLEVDERAVALTSVRLLADHLGLDRAYVAQIDKDHDRAEIGPEYRRPDLRAVEGFLTLSEFPEAFAQMEAATLVLADTAADTGLSELDRAGFTALRMGALIVASARKGERNPVWTLLVAAEEPRRWTAAEVALVEDVAERT